MLQVDRSVKKNINTLLSFKCLKQPLSVMYAIQLSKLVLLSKNQDRSREVKCDCQP